MLSEDSFGRNSLGAEEAALIIDDGMQVRKMKILVGKDAKMQDMFSRLMPVGYTKMFYDKMKGLLPEKKKVDNRRCGFPLLKA